MAWPGVVMLLTSVLGFPPNPGPGWKWDVVFHDPFDGNELNSSVWTKVHTREHSESSDRNV